MKKTGELLKKTREEKSLSLHEIGLSLKINSKILKAIEDGDIDQLPAKTFLRGFVQSYAQYLKLNPQEVLKTFTEEMGSTRPEVAIETPAETTSGYTSAAYGATAAPTATTTAPSKTTVAPAFKKEVKEKPISEERNYKNGMVIGVVAILLGLILLTKRVVDRYQKEAEIQTTTKEGVKDPLSADDMPDDESKQAPVVMGPLPDPAAASAMKATSETSHAASTTSSSFTAATNKREEKANATTPTPPVAAAPKNEEKKSTVAPAVPVVTAPPVEKPAEKSAAVAVPEKNMELIIEALDNVEVELITAQGKVEKLKLASEQVHRFKAKSGVKLNVSNGGAVNIILNGKDVGVPGVLGQPIKLSY